MNHFWTYAQNLRVIHIACLLLLIPILVIYANNVQSQNTSNDSATSVDSAKEQTVNGYQIIDWPDLMPKDDIEALTNPPESLNNILDGSPEDQLSSQIQSAIEQANDSRYQQALTSTRIVPEFDGQAVRLPGFIVPLEFDDDMTITQFFLVPYFGACIHVPPPPPNQIIYAEYGKGFKLEALYNPFWISGILSTQLIENDVATAAYSINVKNIAPYDE